MTRKKFRCKGNEPFVYVRCCSSDTDRVYPIIAPLYNEGYRLHLDDSERLSDSAGAGKRALIKKCEHIMFFISADSILSEDVITDFVYACASGKNIVFVHLDSVDRNSVDPAMRGELTINQGIMWFEMAEGERERKIRDSIRSCKSHPPLRPVSVSPDEEDTSFGEKLGSFLGSLVIRWKELSVKGKAIFITSAVLILCLLVLAVSAISSQCAPKPPKPDYTPAEFFNYYEKDGGIVISGYTGVYKKIIIPSEINGLKVIEIGDEAFSSNMELYSAALPEGITKIGSNAFSGCYSLNSVTMYDSVLEIGDGAFSNCDELETIDLSASLEYLGAEAFRSCESLKQITLPSTLTQINEYTFNYCIALEEIVIPENVRSIGDNAFYNCTSLSSAALPEGLKKLGESAFGNCESLTAINIPDGMNTIEYGTFYNCKSLENIALPDSLTAIGGSAFNGCRSLREIEIPANVSEIGSSAFSSCSRLDRISFLGGKLSKISAGTFYECASLEHITLPNGIESIDNAAFAYCHSLFSLEIPDSVVEVGDYVFEGCSNLYSVKIGAGVESIGKNTFSNCGISLFYGTVEDRTYCEYFENEITVTAPHKASYYGCKPGKNIVWKIEKSE